MFSMKSALRVGFVLAGILALTAHPAWTEDKPRTDSTGDPLPDGAVARLGSVRWRHTGTVKFLAYVNGGKEIVSSADDGVFHVWDAETGKEVRHFGDPLKTLPNQAFGWGGGGFVGWQDPNRTFQVAVPDDGKTLAAAAPDQKIHIWEIATGKELRSFAHAHQQFASALAYSPDGKVLVSRGPDQKIKIWDAAEGKMTKEFMEQGGGNVFWGNGGMPLVFSPDNKTVAGASTSFDGGRGGITSSLRIWDVKEGKELQKIKEGTPRGQMMMNLWPAYSPDSKNIAWPQDDGTIQIFEAANGKEGQKIGEQNTDRRVLRMQYSPDGKSLAVLTSDQTIVLFDPSNGKKVKEIGEEPPGVYGKAMPKAIRANPLNFALGRALAFSPDGKTIAQSWGNMVRQWNLETGKGNDIYTGHAGDVTAVLLSPDGKAAVTTGSDNVARKWEISSGKQTEAVELPAETVTTLLTGLNRAVVRDDGALRVWDLKSGKESLKIDNGGGGGVNPFTGLPGQVSLAPDGKSVATSGSDQAVRVFNLETGKQINAEKDLQLGDPQGRKMLYTLAAAPDASTVAVQMYILELVVVPAASSIIWSAARSTSAPCATPCSTRPTACSISVSDPISNASCAGAQPTGKRSSSPPPCPRRSSASCTATCSIPSTSTFLR